MGKEGKLGTRRDSWVSCLIIGCQMDPFTKNDGSLGKDRLQVRESRVQ